MIEGGRLLDGDTFFKNDERPLLELTLADKETGHATQLDISFFMSLGECAQG